MSPKDWPTPANVSTIVYTSNSLWFPPSDSFEITVTDGSGGRRVFTFTPF